MGALENVQEVNRELREQMGPLLDIKKLEELTNYEVSRKQIFSLLLCSIDEIEHDTVAIFCELLGLEMALVHKKNGIVLSFEEEVPPGTVLN